MMPFNQFTGEVEPSDNCGDARDEEIAQLRALNDELVEALNDALGPLKENGKLRAQVFEMRNYIAWALSRLGRRGVTDDDICEIVRDGKRLIGGAS